MIKKLLLTFTVLFIVVAGLKAQTCAWLKQGGYNRTNGYYSKTAIDHHNNIVAIFATDYYAPVFGTDTFAALAHNNAVVVKYDSSGNYLWGIILKTSQQGNSISGLAIDYNDNIYVAGTFSNIPFYLSAHDSMTGGVQARLNSYLAKYSPSGTLIWAKEYDASSTTTTELRALAIDHANNVIVGGDYFYSALLGDTTLNGGQQNVLIIKYREGGHFLWARGDSSIVYTWVGAMACDSENNIYFTGKTTGSEKFGNINYQVVPGSGDRFCIGKYDSSGNFK